MAHSSLACSNHSIAYTPTWLTHKLSTHTRNHALACTHVPHVWQTAPPPKPHPYCFTHPVLLFLTTTMTDIRSIKSKISRPLPPPPFKHLRSSDQGNRLKPPLMAVAQQFLQVFVEPLVSKSGVGPRVALECSPEVDVEHQVVLRFSMV